jgi:flotillin
MTVISSDGTGATTVGQGVAGQLATSLQIVKDVTGIDIAQVINARVTGEAIGEGLNTPPRRTRATKPAE